MKEQMCRSVNKAPGVQVDMTGHVAPHQESGTGFRGWGEFSVGCIEFWR